MAAEIFGVSHVPTWLAEIEISSMWSLVTPLAELIKMVQYTQPKMQGPFNLNRRTELKMENA